MSEHFAVRTSRLEALEIAPVELTRRELRHIAARDTDLYADVQPRIFGSVDAGKLREHALAGHASVFDLDRHPSAGSVQAPGVVFENVLGRIREGLNLNPTLHTERSRNLAERDDALVAPFRTSRLGKTG